MRTSRTTYYEARIGGEVVARGDADFLSGVLFVAPTTIQHLKLHGVELVRLPVQYEWRGELFTFEELVAASGVKRESLRPMITRGKLGGHFVQRHVPEEFSIDPDKLEVLRRRK